MKDRHKIGPETGEVSSSQDLTQKTPKDQNSGHIEPSALLFFVLNTSNFGFHPALEILLWNFALIVIFKENYKKVSPSSFAILSCFETGSVYVALALLEFTVKTRPAQNSERAPCLCLQATGIKGIGHHTQQYQLSSLHSLVTFSIFYPKKPEENSKKEAE